MVFPYLLVLIRFQNNTRHDTKKRYLIVTFPAVEKLSPTAGSDGCMVRRKGEKQAAHASLFAVLGYITKFQIFQGRRTPLQYQHHQISLKPQEHRVHKERYRHPNDLSLHKRFSPALMSKWKTPGTICAPFWVGIGPILRPDPFIKKVLPPCKKTYKNASILGQNWSRSRPPNHFFV